jgi:chromosome segregation ATPase
MRMNLAGVVRNRAEAMERLRRLHVRPVDTDREAMTAPSLESELAQAREQITKLEADLAEARKQADDIKAGHDALQQELAITQETLTQAKADTAAQGTQVQTLTGERDDLSAKLKEAEGWISTLEAAEQDLNKRASAMAARIVAETGTPQPAAITPKVEAPDDIVARFKAITDPTEQTAFWRSLTPAQRAAILSTANQ